MGLREKLNHPAAVAVVVAMLCLILVVLWLRRDSDAAEHVVLNKAYFSVDDGATFFVDDANKLPPFDHQGKPAYRCMVYTTDGSTTKYVGYLLRYPEDTKQKFEAAVSSRDEGASMRQGMVLSASAEVKVPGQADWINISSPAAVAIMNPKGSPEPQPVLP